ncbi:MAG: hypothetical protein E6G95_21195 [Alphaproteobacteria bacterium]|nr:MAG: hypothetical protein E6G95_21195 [Alphaproteobacteria bacterium]
MDEDGQALELWLGLDELSALDELEIVIELVLEQQQMLALLLPIEMIRNRQNGPIVLPILPKEVDYCRLID